MSTQPEIRILNTPAELFEAAATQFAQLANQGVKDRGGFSVALSGGSTPKGMFALLAGDKFASVPWDQISFFWSDERYVPFDHPDSNYRMANEALLSRVPVPRQNIFPVPTDREDAASAAEAYERSLKDFFKLQDGEFPRFDLILLGMGPDGHTASLFPGTAALDESKRLVVANWVEKLKTHRITFTFPLLNNAAALTFLAAGEDKAGTLHQVLEDPNSGLPSQRVRLKNGRLVWLVDRAAASQLSEVR
jgi:6-phosphogluconolactonase